MRFDGVKARFNELAIVAPEQIQSCTETEVSLLEQRLQQPLPQAYREFLLWMGRGAGSFWQGSHCFYENLLNLQKWAPSLLKENNFPKPLPKDAFVFWMHQGYMFAFFRLSEGNDPPVYAYYAPEQLSDFEVDWPHFGEFLLAEAESHKKYEAEVKKAIEMMEHHESQQNAMVSSKQKELVLG